MEAPDPKTIPWAQGVLPSVRGNISVQWPREERQLTTDVDLPAERKTTIAVGRDKPGRAVTLDGKPAPAADLIVVGKQASGSPPILPASRLCCACSMG